MTTEKTSDILAQIQLDINTVHIVRQQVHMDLEEDARIEDLQIRYRDLVQEKYAQYMVQLFNARKRANISVVMKCEELCAVTDALYRLVK